MPVEYIFSNNQLISENGSEATGKLQGGGTEVMVGPLQDPSTSQKHNSNGFNLVWPIGITYPDVKLPSHLCRMFIATLFHAHIRNIRDKTKMAS